MATIKAGTYKWNDSIAIKEFFSFKLNFTISIFNIETGQYEINTFDTIHFENESTTDTPDYILDYCYYGGSTLQNIYSPYNDLYKWNYGYEFYKAINDELSLGITEEALESLKGVGQIITVTEDCETDDDLGTWFNDNTEPTTAIIKAGTYRFNDSLDLSSQVNGSLTEINFYINTAISDTPTVQFLSFYSNNNILYYYSDGIQLQPYTTDGWDTSLANEIGGLDYLRTITVTEDTEVDDTFAKWFDANTEPVSSEGDEEEPDVPTEPETPTINRKKFTRLYIGDIVATAGSKCFKRLTTYYNPALDITDLSNTTWYVPSGWVWSTPYSLPTDCYINDVRAYNLEVGRYCRKNSIGIVLRDNDETCISYTVGPGQYARIYNNQGFYIYFPAYSHSDYWLDWLKTYGQLQ